MTEKKTALVTGGTRGIGAAICESLKAEGYKVIANYAGNDEAAEKFRDKTEIETVKFDVADFASCQQAVKDMDIDILVNNAGITRDGMMHKMDHTNWQAVIDTNLGSCFNMCRAVIEGMRNRKWGRIINISSINGQKGQIGQVNYSAAKAGILGFTRALAQESAQKNVTVNAICPGYIETEMTGMMKADILQNIIGNIPTARMGHPQEIADLVAFLASDKAAFITGATLSANGGQYMA